MLPPATFTGTLALTAFWLALANDRAACSVADFWSDCCAWPEPPQPMLQLEPAAWFWLLPWLVLALLPAPLLAPLAAFWEALLAPPAMLPPAMLTGTLAFTVFCPALASEAASWPVSEPCWLSCACPAPPQPTLQLEPADWFWLLPWLVPALWPAPLLAPLTAF